MSKFNQCEQVLLRNEEDIESIIGAIASAAITVEEERAVFAAGACLLTNLGVDLEAA